MKRNIVITFLACFFASLGIANAGHQADVMGNEIIPLIKKMRGNEGLPDAATLKLLRDAIRRFNAPHPKEMFGVKSINPQWLAVRLGDRKVKRVALSMCGADLHSCTEAVAYLKKMTAQCTNTKVFLGIIDLGTYPNAPRNPYGAPDSRLILLLTRPGSEVLERVRINAVTNPNIVAIVMCPEESNAFGHVLRSLGGFGR